MAAVDFSKTYTIFRLAPAVVLSVSLLPFLAACAMDQPTQFTAQKVEVHSQMHDAGIMTKTFDQAAAAEVAGHYSRYGSGPVEVTLTYDPYSKTYRASDAGNDSVRVAALLEQSGIRDVRTDLLPVKGTAPQTFVRYMTHTAHAPAGCDDMSIMRDEGIETFRDYKLGCTAATYLARQISRPSDLLGRDKMDDSDGKRTVNVIQRYKAGLGNPPLDSYSVSD